MATVEQELDIEEILGRSKEPWRKPVNQLKITGAWNSVIEVAKRVAKGEFSKGVPVGVGVFLRTYYDPNLTIPLARLDMRLEYTGKKPYTFGPVVRYEATSRGVGVRAGILNPTVCYTDTKGWKYLNNESEVSYVHQLEQALMLNPKPYNDPRHGSGPWVDIGDFRRAFVPQNPSVISIPLNPL